MSEVRWNVNLKHRGVSEVRLNVDPNRREDVRGLVDRSLITGKRRMSKVRGRMSEVSKNVAPRKEGKESEQGRMLTQSRDRMLEVG